MSMPQQESKPLALIVDDDYTVQHFTKKILENCGFNVDVAAESNEALILVKRHHYNVIFMDVGLPGKDGAVTTREIREFEKSQQQHPTIIIALTTFLDGEHQNYCLSMGMDDFFKKPVQENKILSLIKRYPEIAHCEGKNPEEPSSHQNLTR